ncbi:DUF6197 family protein [Streptomyces microflavus]|uniref:DUF6197 family protein n=1 Tax=Streptomyces microflavus TaxID=1919 RepID=UPI0036AF08B6
MTPEEILNSAADIIRRDGWYQGDNDNGDSSRGPVCLMGAIGRACTGNSRASIVDTMGDFEPGWEAAGDAVQRVVATIGTDYVGNWNDRRERTAEDVLLTLKKAAND